MTDKVQAFNEHQLKMARQAAADFERMFNEVCKQRDDLKEASAINLIAAKALLKENQRLKDEVQGLTEDNEILERRLAHGGQQDRESSEIQEGQ